MASILDLAKDLDMSYNTLYRLIERTDTLLEFVTIKKVIRNNRIIINDYSGLKQSIIDIIESNNKLT